MEAQWLPSFSTTNTTKNTTIHTHNTQSLHIFRFSSHPCFRSTYCGKIDSNPTNNVRTIRTRRRIRVVIVQLSFRERWVDEDGEDGDVGFRFRDKQKKRRWWSDNEDDDEDLEAGDEGSGVLEEFIDRIWILKVMEGVEPETLRFAAQHPRSGAIAVQVFGSYGWMLPVIIISLLLADGPKAFLMALALPLGQSIFSFALDKLFGTTRDRPKRNARAKRRPFARTTSNVEESEEEQREGSATSEQRQGYQSWVGTDNGAAKGDKQERSFGGWDELDGQRMSGKGPMKRPTRTAGAPPGLGMEKGKFSRRGRHRDTPLLLRLLIAVFPFLGSWTKLL
ncbi:hypothetical protein Syun_030150 [Stephania yunnanensis]|uniref:Uncharacterized protein n=1 Tax=Stephania yunnanensis TaxID=152371 RepID=A0AAP0E6Z6_9MAGN